MLSEEINVIYTMLVMINVNYGNHKQQWLNAMQLLVLMHVTLSRQTDKGAKYPALGKGFMWPITLVTAAKALHQSCRTGRKMSSIDVQSQQERCQRMYAELCSPSPHANLRLQQMYYDSHSLVLEF